VFIEGVIELLDGVGVGVVVVVIVALPRLPFGVATGALGSKSSVDFGGLLG